MYRIKLGSNSMWTKNFQIFKLDLGDWITEKAKELQKNTYFCFTDYATAFDCVDHNKLENS